MDDIKLSVIVPIFNVEEYLEECLESIRKAIRGIKAEVLLIDDGSNDNSPKISVLYSEKYPQFFYYRKENGGISDTRNYGVSLAKGEYISFIDSDDVISEDYYSMLIRSADENGCDMAIINTARFSSKKIWPSSLHQIVFQNNGNVVTHITKCSNLVYDSTVTNKLIKRSFFVKNHFEFPKDWIFEDMPVSLEMHCKANKVSLIYKPGYFWRVREGRKASATQQNDKVRNLEHRLQMLDRMLAFLVSESEFNCVIDSLKEKILHIDLLIYINQLETISEYDQDQYIDLLADFLAKHFSCEDYNGLSVLNSSKYHCLLRKDKDRLLELISYGKRAYFKAPFDHGDPQASFIKLPEDIFGSCKHVINNEFINYYPINDISKLVCDNNKLIIEAFVICNKLNNKSIDDQSVKAILFNTVNGKSIVLETERFYNDDYTNRFGFLFNIRDDVVSEYDYRAAGFRVMIDANRISELSMSDHESDYMIMIEYKNDFCEGSFVLNATNSGIIDHCCRKTICSSNSLFVVQFDEIGNLILKENRNASIIDADLFALSVDDIKDAELYSNNVFFDDSKYRDDGIIISGDDRRITYYIDRNIIFIRDVAIQNDQLVLYCYYYSDDYGPAPELYCYDKRYDKYYYLSSGDLEKCNDGKNKIYYSIDTNAGSMIDSLREADFVLKGKVKDDSFVDVISISDLDVEKETESNSYRVYAEANEALLSCRTKWKPEDSCRDKRAYNRRKYYKDMRDADLNERMILFESYKGNELEGNPKYLYEYIDLHYPGYTCIISLLDEKTPIKGNGIRVRKYSKEYYYYLATSKYLVDNDNFEKSFVKRKEQVEIHFSELIPAKPYYIGYRTKKEISENRNNDIKWGKRWNYYAVQGKEQTDRVKDIYGFTKTILRTGFPENDHLLDSNNEGMDLFVSTFDKNKMAVLLSFDYYNNGTELAKYLADKSDDKYMFILYDDHNISISGLNEHPNIISISRNEISIDSLIKKTDIFITDNDLHVLRYAIMNKPIIYANRSRTMNRSSLPENDLSIDDMPCIVVHSRDELLEQLNDYKSLKKVGTRKQKSYRKKKLDYERSKASEQICKIVLDGKRSASEIVRKSAKKAIKKVVPSQINGRIKRSDTKSDNNYTEGK